MLVTVFILENDSGQGQQVYGVPFYYLFPIYGYPKFSFGYPKMYFWISIIHFLISKNRFMDILNTFWISKTQLIIGYP